MISNASLAAFSATQAAASTVASAYRPPLVQNATTPTRQSSLPQPGTLLQPLPRGSLLDLAV